MAKSKRKNPLTDYTEEDLRLLDLVLKYSDQFEDMLFSEGSFTYPYAAVQDANTSGTVYQEDSPNCTDTLPGIFACFSYSDFFRFKVKKIKGGYDGCFEVKSSQKRLEELEEKLKELSKNLENSEEKPKDLSECLENSKKKLEECNAKLEECKKGLGEYEYEGEAEERPILTISSCILNNPYDQNTESEQYKEAEKERAVVILHEMIHLHELVFDQVSSFYRDTYLWALYNHLKPLISDLDKRISGHAHLMTQQAIIGKGGEHDILFLLKSYDLDLQNGYKLGTVFGYRDREGDYIFFEKPVKNNR